MTTNANYIKSNCEVLVNVILPSNLDLCPLTSSYPNESNASNEFSLYQFNVPLRYCLNSKFHGITYWNDNGKLKSRFYNKNDDNYTFKLVEVYARKFKIIYKPQLEVNEFKLIWNNRSANYTLKPGEVLAFTDDSTIKPSIYKYDEVKDIILTSQFDDYVSTA